MRASLEDSTALVITQITPRRILSTLPIHAIIVPLYKQAKFAGYHRWLASFSPPFQGDSEREEIFRWPLFSRKEWLAMTITLTISEVCQIILVVVALITLFRGPGNHTKKRK